jgi:N-acetylglucosaminyldiphosphoundecaprenol N-acetyl-beta-D-mannosaminyltransferase
VCLGAPKQELFSDRNRARLAPAVLIGFGAAVDFAAGTMPRAPAWLSRIGLEWAFRLGREPRRLAARYLLRDPEFFTIVAKQALQRRRHK